ncbi:MAG: alpha-1,2-fucosyltransferase [Methanoregula sp.]
MIITQLIGGLGNQMFQYALGRRLSCMHNVPLKLDITGFKDYSLRTYRLNHFALHADFASDKDIDDVKFHNRTGILRTLDSLAGHLQPYYRRNVYKEPHFQYDPNILKCKPDVYLEGYWQTEKYFSHIADAIRRDFTIAENPDPRNREMADIIRDCEAVSLHVRRGDYVSNPVTNAYHGTCREDYYRQAIRIIEKQVENPRFFLFSDDPSWVSEHMDTGHPTTYMDINGPEKDYEDMRLLSLCRHHIIANSSFSWWGAWLCSNPGKMVIAPQRWFTKRDINTRDITPQEWTRI